MSGADALEPVPGRFLVQGSLFAEFDPLDAEARQTYIADHPLMLATGGYALPTPPLVAALTQIVSSIMAGTPGIAWVAVPRFGKTTAIRLIKEKIGEALNGTPVVGHIARRHAKSDEGRFYKELLESSDMAVPPGRDAGDRFNRLWKGWWSQVLTRRSKRIVLIIDEAQKLSEAEYSWLIDVANILAEKRISLCVVLFGQPDLLSVRQTFFQVGRMDILGRFMVQVHTFEGIRNAEQLAEVMLALDDEALSEYPPGSRCACTQFFAPRAFGAGWRLHHYAILLWREFERCALDTGQDLAANPMQVAMAWVRIALVHVLQQLMEVDAERPLLPEDVWRSAAECSGYQQSLGVLDKPVDLDESDD
ncbi:MAG: ATP-binding protein [Pseudomonadota bacterium]